MWKFVFMIALFGVVYGLDTTSNSEIEKEAKQWTDKDILYLLKILKHEEGRHRDKKPYICESCGVKHRSQDLLRLHHRHTHHANKHIKQFPRVPGAMATPRPTVDNVGELYNKIDNNIIPSERQGYEGGRGGALGSGIVPCPHDTHRIKGECKKIIIIEMPPDYYD